jgi:hypothetical protein
LLSVFFIWESLRKTTYRCRELALISVSGPKYFTLVGTNFIESAKLQALAIAPMPALSVSTGRFLTYILCDNRFFVTGL